MSTREVYLGLKKNTATVLYTALAHPSDADLFITNPTLAAGDARISIDGAAFANLGTLPAVTPAGDIAVKIVLAQAEMNGDNIVILFDDQTATEEWQAHMITIRTRAVTADDLVRSTTPANSLTVDASGRAAADAVAISGDTVAADNLEAYSDGTTPQPVNVTQFGGSNGTFASGRPEVNMTHIAGSAVSTSSAQLGVNIVNLGGSAVDQSAGLINANVKQISGDATAADNLESYTDGSAKQPVDVKAIDGDTTAPTNCKLMFNGTGYAGGTTPLDVNVKQISSDATAADNLESYCDGNANIPADAVKISGDATAADNAEAALDGNGYAFPACVMPTVTTVTNSVGVNLAQAISEGQTPRTVGGALESVEAEQRNKVVDEGTGGTRTVYRSNSTTPLIARTRADDETIAP